MEATWEEAFLALKEGLKEARGEEVGLYLAHDATPRRASWPPSSPRP